VSALPKDRVVLVTAAAQGIGRAVAQAFIAAGARVWATDINEAGLKGLDGAQTRRLDVRDTEAVGALVAEIGRVDILCNCAGFVHAGTVL
jgi:2-keto-3-deoxy-L-fuconate dehydrogenase